ncbi:hypothetical protein MP638_001039 [Amoeboaphelidium occidentale]|nr:hypothetical protein MP638_001039 [Amoeboaphelidium occidentale]
MTLIMSKLKGLIDLSTVAERKSYVKIMCVMLLLTLVTAATFMALFFVTKAQVDALQSQESCKVNDVCLTPDCAETAGAMISRMDFDVDPCDDFYKYSCGSWQEDNRPEKQIRDMIRLRNSDRVRAIMDLDENLVGVRAIVALDENLVGFHEFLNNSKIDQEVFEKMKKFYRQCGTFSVSQEDPVIIIEGSDEEEQSWFIPDEIFLMSDAELKSEIQQLIYESFMVSGAWFVVPDIECSGRDTCDPLVVLGQANKEFYENEEFIIALALVATSFNGSSHGNEIMTHLLALHDSVLDAFDENEEDEPLMMKFSQLNSNYPGVFNWTLLADSFHYSLETTVKVLNPGFLSRLNVIFSNAEPITMLAYSAATRVYLESDIPWKSPYLLDNRLNDAGVLEEICLQEVIKVVDASIDIVKNMFENLKSSFKKQIQNSERLSSDTKAGMVSKLDAIEVIYGYPQTFLDDRFFEAFFREFTLSDEEDGSIAYGDTWRRNIPKWMFLRKFQAARFSDRFSMYRNVLSSTDWLTEPNAFYQPFYNSIVIQISTLTPPWFSTDYPASVYYGSLGYILGHEIGHAFDSDRIEESWLADEDRDEFIEEYRCLVRHYSNYTLVGEINEGNKTLGENVADKIGIKMAHEAMSGTVKETKLPGLSDLTGDQIFFVAAGQTWCSRYSVLTIKEELERNKSGLSAHTIDPIRVNAMMSQSSAFLKAFQCSADSRMNAKDKCNLWKREFP